MVVETERLRLRPIAQSDFAELLAMFSDPLVARFLARAFDEPEMQVWIDWMLQERYAKHGFGLWAVELKGPGTFLGVCGPILQTVDDQAHVEIGYHFASRHWHRGYATEAARASKEWAFARLGCAHVISIIRPENVASRAVAERNGMTVWKATRFKGFEVLVYRVNADGPPGAWGELA